MILESAHLDVVSGGEDAFETPFAHAKDIHERSPMTELSIRTAKADDAALLLSLIYELADAEAFPFAVTVTEHDLRQSLFASSPAAEAVLAFVADRPVGFAVFYETFATTTGRRGLHLDDLFVRAEHQGKGCGCALLRYVARVAQQRGCARFEWWCLRTNDRAMRFYRSMGARALEELIVFRTEGASLAALAGSPSER